MIPMQSLHKIFLFAPKSETEETEETSKGDVQISGHKEQTEEENVESSVEEPEEVLDLPQIKSRQHLLAHREVLEEIPEVELEFEAQRDKLEGLEEILEEEEDEDLEDEMNHLDEEDMEIIEEEGGEDFWADREEYVPRRSFSRQDDRDNDEWEWTANGSGRAGAQYNRYAR